MDLHGFQTVIFLSREITAYTAARRYPAIARVSGFKRQLCPRHYITFRGYPATQTKKPSPRLCLLIVFFFTIS